MRRGERPSDAPGRGARRQATPRAICCRPRDRGSARRGRGNRAASEGLELGRGCLRSWSRDVPGCRDAAHRVSKAACWVGHHPERSAWRNGVRPAPHVRRHAGTASARHIRAADAPAANACALRAVRTGRRPQSRAGLPDAVPEALPGTAGQKIATACNLPASGPNSSEEASSFLRMGNVAMIRAAVLSAALMSWIPGQAIASAWDNVPPSWRAERYRNSRPAFGSPDAVSTTESIRPAPPRVLIERPRPAGAQR